MPDSIPLREQIRYEFYKIDQVVIEGNKRTKERIIRRELDFQEGDSIPVAKLDSLLKWERNKLFNTNLFVTTDVRLQRIDSVSNLARIYIHLREQWYTIPQPILDIPDRNYNEWIKTFGADLSRVNIGLKLFQKNVFGLNQTLRFTVQGGFTNVYELFYDIPYLNRNQTFGMSGYINYSNNRKMAYALQEHKLPNVKIEGIIRDFYRGGLIFNYRNQFFTRHSAEIAYNYNHIADTVVNLNPSFFLQGSSIQKYVYLKYTFDDDRRDIKQFAHKGRLFRIEAEQLGFTPLETQRTTRVFVTYHRYFEIGKKFLFAFKLKTKVSFPLEQSWIDYRALGYGQDFVRGYELYSMDGQHFGLGRSAFRYKIYSTLIDFKKIIPIRQFRVMPLDFYLTLFADAGYVANQSSISLDKFNNRRFSNTLLASVGAGINFVTFYNSVVRLEYSYNRAGELNFFFALATDI